MREKENKPRHTLKLPEFKYKTMWRMFGAYQVLLSSLIGAGPALEMKGNTELKNILSILLISAAGLVASDGVVDLVKGTHHFLGLRTWRIFQNEKGKEEIDDEIKSEMLSRDKKPSDFKK